ncbi:MAG: outer membrane beta-barrel protein [Dysgonamonadaceae bacterium]|jgi:opacity protein-like surface antigen|nr:outer membrane beta-barrel protein [Dysgonamonadaceae bacterium]
MKKYFFIYLLASCLLNNGFSQTAENNPSHWRLNLSGGLGYLTASTAGEEQDLIDFGFSSQDVKDAYNDLKWGWQGNADIYYLFHKNFGVGLKYTFFANKGKLSTGFITEDVPIVTSDGSIRIYDVAHYYYSKEKDKLHYIGPSFFAQIPITNTRFRISALVSLGYVRYKSNYEGFFASRTTFDSNNISWNYFPSIPEYTSPERISIMQFVLTGNTLGMDAGAGIEYALTSHIAVGLDLNYFYSKLNKVTIKQGKVAYDTTLEELNGKKADLSRLDPSLSIKFYW